MRLPLLELGDKYISLRSRVYTFLLRLSGMQMGASCRMEKVRVKGAPMVKLGNSNAFSDGCWLLAAFPEPDALRIQIGDNNFFNRDCMIDACLDVRIGSNNMFGPGVYVTDSNHIMEPDQWVNQTPMDRGKVVIGDGCWLGTRATVLKDVELGDRCIVAAGAVVTKSFPAGSVIGGVPARRLR